MNIFKKFGLKILWELKSEFSIFQGSKTYLIQEKINKCVDYSTIKISECLIIKGSHEESNSR